jgi:hypothetical protein
MQSSGKRIHSPEKQTVFRSRDHIGTGSQRIRRGCAARGLKALIRLGSGSLHTINVVRWLRCSETQLPWASVRSPVLHWSLAATDLLARQRANSQERSYVGGRVNCSLVPRIAQVNYGRCIRDNDAPSGEEHRT